MSPRAETSGADRATGTGARVLLIAGLVLLAFNLRPAITTLAPVLNTIRDDFGLGGSAAGILTMLPITCLGLFGAVAAKLGRRFGTEATILGFILLIAAGNLVRGAGSASALFLGMAMAGAGIGIVGVLVPGIIKREFPAQAGLITGVFTMMLVGGASAGAGFTIPLAEALDGWRPALMAWSVPALIAAAIWLPQVVLHHHRPRDAAPTARLWRDPLAWQVTIFMGMQSSMAYMMMAWTPVILEDHGMTARDAGTLSSIAIAVQMFSSLLAAPIAARARDQRPVLAVLVLMGTLGMGGIIFGPLSLVWPFAVVLGLALGGCFSVALTLIVLRSPDGQTAAELSSMAQSVGYVIASLGPFMIGFLHGLTGGWAVPGLFYTAVTLVALASGLLAGRPRHVGSAA